MLVREGTHDSRSSSDLAVKSLDYVSSRPLSPPKEKLDSMIHNTLRAEQTDGIIAAAKGRTGDQNAPEAAIGADRRRYHGDW